VKAYRRENGIGNAAQVAHVIVPETQDGIALLVEILCSYYVSLGFGVLAAIELNDERRLATNKVCDIRPYRKLPYELVSAESASSQHAPELVFGIRLSAA
jgi:hypothetical protein